MQEYAQGIFDNLLTLLQTDTVAGSEAQPLRKLA